MALQSYTLAQLAQLQLLAFRKDWEDALQFVNYELLEASTYATFINKHGLIKLITEYNITGSELENQLDFAVCYLINNFDIK